MNTFLFKIDDFGGLSRGGPRMGFPEHAETAQWVSRQTKKHANEARQKSILAAATARSSQSRMISKPFRSHLGRHSAAQAKRFRELCKIWSTKTCMPVFSLVVEITDSDEPNHGVFRVLDGAKKGAQEERESVSPRTKQAKWTYVQ